MVTEKRTEIAELGEFGLIERLTAPFKNLQPSTLMAAGDDAAVIRAGDECLLLTTDILAEGVHFDLAYTPLRHLGYKAMAVNFSDICAMNGRPTQAVVSIAVSNRFSVEALEELYAGIRLACERYEVDLVGGDTSASLQGLFINAAVMGRAKEKDVTYRGGAQPGDLICVSGDLGAAYIGLQLLEREKQVYMANPAMQPELKGHDYELRRQLKPEPRTDIIKLFADKGVKPTAMIDISDGLSSDVKHLCRRSGTGCMLLEKDVPIAESAYNQAVQFRIDPINCALSGGEDYELLFTLPEKEYEKLKGSPDLTVIGRMTAAGEGCKITTKGGNILELQALGWNAFPPEANE